MQNVRLGRKKAKKCQDRGPFLTPYADTETVTELPGSVGLVAATVATAANDKGFISGADEFTSALMPLVCPLVAPSGSFATDPVSDKPDGVLVPSVDVLPLLIEGGAGALRISAAVGPFIGLATGLREGGVTEPPSTGNSSALGTRCDGVWNDCWAARPLAPPRFSWRTPFTLGPLLRWPWPFTWDPFGDPSYMFDKQRSIQTYLYTVKFTHRFQVQTSQLLTELIA